MEKENLPAVTGNTDLSLGTADILFRDGMLERLERFALAMSKGASTLPDHLKGKPADCMAIVMQAAQWKMNPFAVAQKTHLVSGTLGYEAQLVNAVITTMAPTKGRIQYEWFGPWENVIGKYVEKTGRNNSKYLAPGWSLDDERGCGVRVWATMKGESEPRVLELLLSQALVRNSTLWASDPKQQLAYLATKRWSRLHAPDVIMGVYTPDELDHPPLKEMGDAVVVHDQPDSSASQPSTTESLKGKLRANGDEKPSAGTAKKTVGHFKKAISAASTMSELDAAISGVTDLTEKQRDDVRLAYAEQRAAIMLGDILDMISSASDQDGIDAAMDLARGLPDKMMKAAQDAAKKAASSLK